MGKRLPSIRLRPRTMDARWRLGSGSAAEAGQAARDKNLAFTTVQTTLRVLERRGFVDHVESGRTHIFQPLVNRTAAKSNALYPLRHAFFEGSASSLIMHLFENESTASATAELERLLKKEQP